MVDRYEREVKRLLREHGCTFVRHGKGDHEIWYSPITKSVVVLDRGGRNKITAQATLKRAGIKACL